MTTPYDEKYDDIFFNQYKEYRNGKVSILPRDAMIALIIRFVNIIKNEPIEINLKPDGDPVVIVGDIHGSFKSFSRVLNAVLKLNSKSRFIFLGDYVDRGEHSIEVLTYLMLLKVAHPDIFYFLRGNHESGPVNSEYGFKNECLSKYDIDVFNLIVESYDYYSLTCVIADIFCVHGCITKYHDDYQNLIKMKKPVNQNTNEAVLRVMTDLLWSDPCEGYDYINLAEKKSIRGNLNCYGKATVDSFCKMKNVNHVFRAHQCVMNGFATSPDLKVITLFSSANYGGVYNNKGCYLFLSQLESGYSCQPYQFNEPFFIDNSTAFQQSDLNGISKSEQNDNRIIKDSENNDVSKIYKNSNYRTVFN